MTVLLTAIAAIVIMLAREAGLALVNRRRRRKLVLPDRTQRQ